jgi:hypothetical protein
MPIGVAAPGVLAQGPDGGMQAGEQS